MRILTTGLCFLHEPWMTTISKWAGCRDIDAIAVTGDMCPVFDPYADSSETRRVIKEWIQSIAPKPVFWSRGRYDSGKMDSWGCSNLLLDGEHFLNGWRVCVFGIRNDVGIISTTEVPTVILSYFPPGGSQCSIGIDGRGHGDMWIRGAIEHAGDCRLVLCGHVMDPQAHIDWAEGALVANHGMSPKEHDDAPAFLTADLGARTVILHDGIDLQSYSFAR